MMEKRWFIRSPVQTKVYKINKEEAESALSGSGYKLLGITYEEGVKESFSYRLKKKFRS